MDRKHYTQVKSFRIYALLLHAEENYVYVGKTTAKRMSAVYSRHRSGSVKATACYFDQEESPELYLLETCDISTSEAYRRVVAWCHLFLEAGYAGINHDGTLSHARNLLPETKQIVKLLGQEPLTEVLRRTYLKHPSDGDLKPEKVIVTEGKQKTIQMNIRIGKQDKKRFDCFCREGGLNQREGFTVLLDRISDSADHSSMALLLKKREEKIEYLKQENSHYKAKLEAQTDNGKIQRETVLEKKLEFQKKGIQRYLHKLFPENEGETSLPEISWRRYIRNLPKNERPVYPATEGFWGLQLETIVWGNPLHRPCFLVGWGEDGKRYMLRCYPRADFIGFSIRESAYAKPGMFWYVGCQQSRDGAMELMMAIPLPWKHEKSIPEKREPVEFQEEERRKASLDSIIQHAERKNQ